MSDIKRNDAGYIDVLPGIGYLANTMTKRGCMATLCLLLMVWIGGDALSAIPRSDPFTVSWDTQELAVVPGHRFQTSLTVHVPPGHYLYAEELDVEFITLEGIHIDDVRFPPAEEGSGVAGMTGKRVYGGSVTIVIEGHIPEELSLGRRELIARVSFEGCATEGCFHPRSEEMSLAMAVTSEGPSEGEPGGASPAGAWRLGPKAGEGIRGLLTAHDFTAILDRGLMWTILLVFIAGLLTSLTPCIWPILPVILVVIGVEKQRSVIRNFLLALSLVAGLVLVYSVMGILSVAIGRNIGFVFQQRWFIVVVIMFFVAMSLSLFGIFEVRPSPRWTSRLHRLGGKGFRGAFLSGLGLGLIASPCTGPVVAALLGYVALQRNFATGFVLLSVFAMGMGSLIVLMGSAYGVVADRLRGGPWMMGIKRTLGLLLLIPAAFYMGTLLSFDGAGPAGEGPSVEWINRIDDGLRFAQQDGRPIMLDFYADWCPPCRRLDQSFFNREGIARLSYRLVPVRIDATYESPEVRRLFERYGVMGLPTILFLGPTGQEYADLRIVVPDVELIERNMREALRRAGATERLPDRGEDEE